MSGPLSLEPGGAEQDTLAIRLADRRRPRRRPSWALGDDTTLTIRLPHRGPDEEAVNELAAELADRVGPAVPPYEVAACPPPSSRNATAIPACSRSPPPCTNAYRGRSPNPRGAPTPGARTPCAACCEASSSPCPALPTC